MVRLLGVELVIIAAELVRGFVEDCSIYHYSSILEISSADCVKVIATILFPQKL